MQVGDSVMVKVCIACGLVNPPESRWCDYGYDLNSVRGSGVVKRNWQLIRDLRTLLPGTAFLTILFGGFFLTWKLAHVVMTQHLHPGEEFGDLGAFLFAGVLCVVGSVYSLIFASIVAWILKTDKRQ